MSSPQPTGHGDVASGAAASCRGRAGDQARARGAMPRRSRRAHHLREEAEPLGPCRRPPVLSRSRRRGQGVRAEPAVFMDKLGERLAFERSGVRLYEALISKSTPSGPGGRPARRSRAHPARRARHFTHARAAHRASWAAIRGAHASADPARVASQGLWRAHDPRTNLRQGLEAILVAELVDNDSWENTDRSAALDRQRRFRRPAASKRWRRSASTSSSVRHWLGVSLSRESTGKLAESFAARAEERDRRLVVATAALETTPGAATGRGRPRPPSAGGTRPPSGHRAERPRPAPAEGGEVRPPAATRRTKRKEPEPEPHRQIPFRVRQLHPSPGPGGVRRPAPGTGPKSRPRPAGRRGPVLSSIGGFPEPACGRSPQRKSSLSCDEHRSCS